MRQPTTTQRLAEQVVSDKLGVSLATYIAEKRSARPRWSWALIVDQLRDDTDGLVDVADTTLRNWYGAAEAAA